MVLCSSSKSNFLCAAKLVSKVICKGSDMKATYGFEELYMLIESYGVVLNHCGRPRVYKV